MDFALWKTVPGTGIEAETAASTRRGLFQIEHNIVDLFVVGVPSGTKLADVIEKLHLNGLPIGNPPGIGFENQWPGDIRDQLSLSLNVVQWSCLK